MPTPCPRPGRDLGSSSSVSPGTPLPPPRVAVPGEPRRAGSVSWDTVSLFVPSPPPPPPLCPALQRVAQEVPRRLPAPQSSPGRSDPPLPRTEPAVPPQCASTSPAPHPGGGQVKAIYLSTCGTARYPLRVPPPSGCPKQEHPKAPGGQGGGGQSRAPLQSAPGQRPEDALTGGWCEDQPARLRVSCFHRR